MATTGGSAAQAPSLWIDALATSARPPAGVGDPAVGVYGLLGARAHWSHPLVNLDAASYVGLGARQLDGRWGALALTASRDQALGRLMGNLEIEGFGLHYSDPIRYTALSVATRPMVTWRAGAFELAGAGELSLGRWSSRLQLRPADPVPGIDPVQSITESRAGALRVAALRSSVAARLSHGSITLGGVLASARNGSLDGTFRGASLSLLQVGNRWDVTLEGQVLAGVRTETGASLRAGRFIDDRVYISAEVGRRVTDFALGVPGHTGATVGVSWQPGTSRAPVRTRPLIVRVGSRDERGTQVMFQLPRTAASSIALVGSFTGWQPLLMNRTADGWSITMVLPEGSHQFAFLLDGHRWYLPDGAPGVIDDGYGRRNATVIIGAM